MRQALYHLTSETDDATLRQFFVCNGHSNALPGFLTDLAQTRRLGLEIETSQEALDEAQIDVWSIRALLGSAERRLARAECHQE